MSEELTPASCPDDDGVAQVLAAHQSKAPEDTEWQTTFISDYIRILPVGTCQHGATMCRECVDSWRNDYIVVLAPPGTPLPDIPEF